MSPTKEEIELAQEACKDYMDAVNKITIIENAYLEAVEALRMVHDSVGSAYYPSEDEIIKIEAILEKAPEEREL
jgi:hypothetical protein